MKVSPFMKRLSKSSCARKKTTLYSSGNRETDQAKPIHYRKCSSSAKAASRPRVHDFIPMFGAASAIGVSEFSPLCSHLTLATEGFILWLHLEKVAKELNEALGATIDENRFKTLCLHVNVTGCRLDCSRRRSQPPILVSFLLQF